MRKFLLKALISRKETYTALFLKLCVVSLFKVLYTDMNFLTKLRKCCHEVMVDNCYKPQVALQILARKVLTFLLRQGCANFFNGGPNTNKHNILRAAPSNRIIFYQISKTILPAIKIKLQ